MLQGTITYRSIDGGKILIRNFLGPVTFEGSIQSWKDIIELKACKILPKGITSDFSESGKWDTLGNITKLIEFFDQHRDFFTGLISAAIVQQPEKTASGELVKQGITELNLPFKHELFFSLDNAIRWMRSKIL